jgi:hypothetical protein
MAQTYEQHLAMEWERYTAECEYHEGQSKYRCEECEVLRDQYEEEMYDRWREDQMLNE